MLKWLLFAVVVPCFVLAGNTAVTVDVSSTRTIKLGEFEKSKLDRDKYFRSYHMPGLFSEKISEELKMIGALPARGTGPYYSHDKQHSYDSQNTAADTNIEFNKWVEKQNDKYVDIYRKAAQRYPGLKHALAFNPNFPEGMRRGNEGKDPAALKSDCYDDFANLIVKFYDRLKAQDCSYPSWYTTQNEPPYQWGAVEFANYSSVLAKAMAAKHPDIKVCGPCSAWPYPQTDWKRWYGWEQKFIEIAGKDMGAYDLHFYSKGYWAYSDERLMGDPLSKRQASPSLYVSQKNGCQTVWDYGRMDAYLDLFAAYHAKYYNSTPKPMIISEFGRQGIEPQLGPWENDFKPWMYMTTVVRMWMSFMERPEVELAVPFILGEADMSYGASRGQAIYNRPNAPDDTTSRVTRFRDFYYFFKDLAGTRIRSDISDADISDSRFIISRAFLDGDKVFILLHNGKGYPDGHDTVSIEPVLGDVGIITSDIKRLRWQGAVPSDHRSRELKGSLRIDAPNGYEPLESLKDIELEGEETVIVRLMLSAEPKTADITEYIDYSRDTLVSLNKKAVCGISVDMPDRQGDVLYAKLQLGLSRDGGFDANPVVMFNGQKLGNFDITYSKGIKDYHCPVEIPLPVDLLCNSNRIVVSFTGRAGNDGNTKIVTAKIITGRKGL